MKDIKDYIIRESQAETLFKVKNGDVLWLCDFEESSNNVKHACIKVTITKVEQEPIPYYSKEGYKRINMYFSDNKFDVPYFKMFLIPMDRYGGMNMQACSATLYNSKGEPKNYYIGTTKEAIEEYINIEAKFDLEPILDKITKLERKLQDLYVQKAQLEAKMETKLQENKQQ